MLFVLQFFYLKGDSSQSLDMDATTFLETTSSQSLQQTTISPKHYNYHVYIVVIV